MGSLKIITWNIEAGNSLVIRQDMNILRLSCKMTTGTDDEGSILGNGSVVDGTDATIGLQPIVLGPGEGETIVQMENSNLPIDGVTLTAVTGTMRVTMSQG